MRSSTYDHYLSIVKEIETGVSTKKRPNLVDLDDLALFQASDGKFFV